jgi:hypothetical protein
LHILSFSDEPSQPGTPEITDFDNQSVDLKWTKPKSDGGAPIEKYIIEKKDRYLHMLLSIPYQNNE